MGSAAGACGGGGGVVSPPMTNLDDGLHAQPNRKSVLLSTITGILGDYHKTSAMETFTASRGDRHPTELADLRGGRLVTASETEEGRHWAESRIKQLTGGDRLSARFRRQDLFEFQPTFKLVIAGNHKPSLRSVDEAMRRRFHMISFTVTIPAAERDGDLTEKLKAEWSGILKWLVEGCLRWQGEKLSPPSAVTVATAEYMGAEDATASWIADKCEVTHPLGAARWSCSPRGQPGRPRPESRSAPRSASLRRWKAGACIVEASARHSVKRGQQLPRPRAAVRGVQSRSPAGAGILSVDPCQT